MNKKSPVLFVVFNRPETTERVFAAIRQYQPDTLYIAADGPREGRENEAELCAATRAIVNQVDWICEIKTLFRDKNVGCGMGVSSAITWFFEHEEYGIILEDDCMPNQDFFLFCNDMLEKYKENPEIMQINGFNPVFNESMSNKYFKTIYPRIWGWATWKNRWEKFSYTLENWDEYANNKKVYNKRYSWFEGIIRHLVWKNRKKQLEKSSNDSVWDYQWNFCIMLNHGLCIQPKANLIKNIGMDSGTHYSSASSKNTFEPEYGAILIPLVEDKEIAKYFDSKIRQDYIIQKFKNLVK